MTTYDVRCPRCGKNAEATMAADGVAGTYREALVRLVARRLVCGHCGYNVTSDGPVPFEFWYKVAVRGRTAGARNRSHAAFLVAYLKGQVEPTGADRVTVETLPGWMMESKNRAIVARRLERLLDGQ